VKVEYTIQTAEHPSPTPDGRQTYTARVLYKGRTYGIGRSTDPDRAFLTLLSDGRLSLHALGDGDLLDPNQMRARVTTVIDRSPPAIPLLIGTLATPSEQLILPHVPLRSLLLSLGLVALGAIYFASRARPEKS